MSSTAATHLTLRSSGHGAALCWVPSTVPFGVRHRAADLRTLAGRGIESTMRITIAALCTMLLLACATQTSPRSVSSGSTIEFRFAQDAPGAGLTKFINRENNSTIYLSPEVLLSDTDVESAKVIILKTGDPAIEVSFTEGGSSKLRALSAANIGRTIAIVANGEVVVAVPIRSELNIPSADLVSHFTQASAEDLVRQLNHK